MPGSIPAIPRPLARRIDRLGRRAHAFHRWAHHPLCAEYAGERVRIGRRTHVCRGCLLAGAGALVGGIAGLAAPRVSLSTVALLLVIECLGLACLLGAMRRERAAPVGPHEVPAQRSKVWTRLVPALVLAFGAMLAVRHGGPLGLAALSVQGALGAAAWLYYRRLGPQRRPCASCPEAGQLGSCRGYNQIVRRERAFARLAGHWLTQTR